MTQETFNVRASQLIKEVSEHSHKDELIRLMREQVLDDVYTNY